MRVSSSSRKVASMTVEAMSQGFTAGPVRAEEPQTSDSSSMFIGSGEW